MLARRTALRLATALALGVLGPAATSTAAPPSFGNQNELGPNWTGVRVATHSSGAILAAAGNSSNNLVEFSYRQPGAAVFGNEAPISAGDPIDRQPEVAFDPAGNAFAIWDDDTDHEIEAALDVVPLGAFAAPSVISNTGNSVHSPAHAVDPFGNGLAIWIDGTANEVEFSFRMAGFTFPAPPPGTIPTPGASPGNPDVDSILRGMPWPYGPGRSTLRSGGGSTWRRGRPAAASPRSARSLRLARTPRSPSSRSIPWATS